MSQNRAPDTDWTLEPIPTADGVAFVVSIPTLSPDRASVSLRREEARVLARALLWAAGDATERTFPHGVPAGTTHA